MFGITKKGANMEVGEGKGKRGDGQPFICHSRSDMFLCPRVSRYLALECGIWCDMLMLVCIEIRWGFPSFSIINQKAHDC
jgi:hypothetical protein